MTTKSRLYLSVDKRTHDGALQMSIGVEDEGGGGHGYRIHGPKYDGRGKTIIRHYLTDQDVWEIKNYLSRGSK